MWARRPHDEQNFQSKSRSVCVGGLRGGRGRAVGAPAGTSPTEETTGTRAGGLMLPVLEERVSFTVKLHPVQGDERDLYADGDWGRDKMGP